eukprot:CAMPEP_0177569652 /NCGR_PEP_ID=MMETSP0369-20130122/76404_1 /TAXON_ID=447022 ORGANISM="Scrippsiella hangoei-like, Strain SHHI-4" /NCGR_SAMPLE_ID=MMETSP0369 /ASSEMBLY_ACC=CAM_ASM_000364 /LENGTH=307 /DNA_ID=CAMNT_0019057303 /DNA_START=363 /DNA_END=1283 /DNA_ORIENTATION=-
MGQLVPRIVTRLHASIQSGARGQRGVQHDSEEGRVVQGRATLPEVPLVAEVPERAEMAHGDVLIVQAVHAHAKASRLQHQLGVLRSALVDEPRPERAEMAHGDVLIVQAVHAHAKASRLQHQLGVLRSALVAPSLLLVHAEQRGAVARHVELKELNEERAGSGLQRSKSRGEVAGRRAILVVLADKQCARRPLRPLCGQLRARSSCRAWAKGRISWRCLCPQRLRSGDRWACTRCGRTPKHGRASGSHEPQRRQQAQGRACASPCRSASPLGRNAHLGLAGLAAERFAITSGNAHCRRGLPRQLGAC